MIAQHAELWILMMKARYGVWSTADQFRADRDSSTLWHEICARILEVTFQTGWILGDGQSTNLLLDLWMANLSLSRWLTLISAEVFDVRRVFDLF